MRRTPLAVALRAGSVTALLAVATVVVPGVAILAHATPTQQVSSTPATGTPRLAASSTTTQQIKQIAVCGSQMYAVGSFPSVIGRNSQVLPRPDAFSFSTTAPYTVSDFAPQVSGVIDTIALSSDCSDAYIGGKFTIAGTSVKNIAEVTTSTGAVVTSFDSEADGVVSSIVLAGGHLLVGGQFSQLYNSHGQTAGSYFDSVSPTTGADDHFFSAALALAGHYSYTDAAGEMAVSNATTVTNQQISPDGTRDLIEGDFMTIGGVSRQQVAMVDINQSPAALDGWNAPEFNAYCNFVAPNYAQAGAWSPDGSTVFFAGSGYKPDSGTGYKVSDPRAGLCDSASSFPATTGATVAHNWINYTGCDSLYSVATDGDSVYFAGHDRWTDNADGCDDAGPGSIEASGIEGLSPTDGSLIANPTRSRGYGADDMLFTSAGLWIASDNDEGSASCGGVSGHAGLCLLPYTSTITEPGPFAAVPFVTGTPAVGRTMTCAEPTQPTDVTVAYSWLLAGVPVSSSPTYAVPAKAYHQTLSCQVTVSRTGSPTGTAESTATTIAVGAALKTVEAPELTHKARAGHRVEARHGQWNPGATSYSYQWYLADKLVKRATSQAYVVPKSAKGKRVRCLVFAHATGYADGHASTNSEKVARK